MARSILWAPAPAPAGGGTRPANIPFPIFLSQSALAAISEHVAAPSRPGQGLLGFLLGDLCECPETNVSYLVIDAALRLNQAVHGDRTRDLVTRLWDKIQAQLEEQQAHLIGWYHTHPPLPLALSPDDVETHEYYFAEPWQVALLLETDPATPAAAFFRGGGDAWVSTPLPFYELLQEESIKPGGKKRSFVTWKNYRAYNPVVPAPAPGPAPASAPAPEDESEPEPEPEPEPEAEPEPEPPAPPRHPREERSSELKFLTSAEDFATPSPSRPAPRARPASPPSRPHPPRHRAAPPPEPEPSPAPALEEDVAPAPEWPEEYQEREEAVAYEQPEEPAPAPPPRVRRRRRRLPRRLRRALVALVVAAAAGGAYWWFQPQLSSLKVPPALLKVPQALRGVPSALKSLASRVKDLPFLKRRPTPSRPPMPGRPSPTRAQTQSPGPTSSPLPGPPSPYGNLDRSGDALTAGVRTFNDRAALFERGQLACGGLAAGLAVVEQRWTAYTTTRRVAGVLDAAHTARDLRLYAGVDSVERRFDRSGCARP